MKTDRENLAMQIPSIQPEHLDHLFFFHVLLGFQWVSVFSCFALFLLAAQPQRSVPCFCPVGWAFRLSRWLTFNRLLIFGFPWVSY